MALQITLTNPITGAEASYWRLLSVFIDVEKQAGLLAIGGYRSQEWRDAGGVGRYVDSESIAVDGAGYAALFAAAAAPTLGQTVAGAAYALIKMQRRRVPAAMPNPDGSVDYQGEHYAAAEVQIVGGIVTLPSKFADAVDV